MSAYSTPSRLIASVSIVLAFGSTAALAQPGSGRPDIVPTRRDETIAAAERRGVAGMAEAISLLQMSGGAVEFGRTPDWDEARIAPPRTKNNNSLVPALARFKQLHPEHRVQVSDDYVTLFPVRSHCVSALEDRVTFRGNGGLARVFSDLLHTINPMNPGGPLGYLRRPDVEEPGILLLDTPVSLDVADVPARDAFGILVRQVPGVVWVVGEEPPRQPGAPHYCRISFYTGGARVSTGWILK